jgi:ATP-dependent helicase/nuclease subunit B
VPARFLLGPAGSGKTFRCLAEIRAALRAAPAGQPLILLAPKQATFQLERQLLADDSLDGYTRLHIFSFERLARFVLEKLNIPPPDFLSDEGRVMTLRALLMRHENELKLFSQSARRPGFARELGILLNELQQHQWTPARLRTFPRRAGLRRELQDKLHDLALLFERYTNWLGEHELQDANRLLDFATEKLHDEFKIQNSKFKIESLWLDGFAEMTPQELDLLAAVAPHCEHATLAFCLDESAAKENSWLSIWNAVGKTFQQCRQRVESLPDGKIKIEILRRDSSKNRFTGNSALQHLERTWSQPVQNAKFKTQNSVRIITCADAGAEATLAAREILKFVRSSNRFRDCAVLVRNLDDYHQPLARVFRRYGIPFFLDRRESVAHHPLAELTRCALRTVVFDWRHDDWFAAQKAGFAPVDQTEIDRLENESLARGWHGQRWREPIQTPDHPELESSLERLRKKILPPFEHFAGQFARFKGKPTGAELAEALRELWSDLKVEPQLQSWNDDDSTSQRVSESRPSIHTTVWEQMNSWLDNLELAFPHEPLPLRDWLPILDAGLANLTVGVIPPALDQVLIGAIDRARNPDLKLALVLGVNESIFPAAPAAPVILTDTDRDELGQTASLGPDLRERISRERYYGYIAATRASEKLIVTHARHDAEGKTLNPSPFIARLKQIFPGLAEENFLVEIGLGEAQHANEIAPLLIETQNSLVAPEPGEGGRFKTPDWPELLALPALAELVKNLRALREPDLSENLSPQIAGKLYGSTLRTSVSRMEEFAACPFRFFVRSGLRAEERKVFELDARERGNFQHDVLKVFHERLTDQKKRWRDLTPREARERIGGIAVELMPDYRDGLLSASAASQFAARAMTESLQDFVEVVVTWMRGQYEFDPAAAELEFDDQPGSRAPAWEINLGGGNKLLLHGRIDRVDLWRDPNGEDALAVVVDYKSSGKKLDAVLVEHGIQLQLLAYLNVLRHWKNPLAILGVKRLMPAGVFYVNLRGEYPSGGTRAEILAETDASRRKAYRHNGRFNAAALPQLDRRGVHDQFSYTLNKDGGLRSNSAEALPGKEFTALLDRVEEQLREMGEKIFAGATPVDPYRKGQQTPCEYCDYQAACRIDKWTHPFRVLRAQAAAEVD